MKSYLLRSLILIPFVLGMAACAPAPAPVVTAPAATTAPPVQATVAPANLTEVTVVMGYIQNIQFAPWFVADKKGYFAQEGLKVKFSWGFEVDGIKLVGANSADFALLGGDQVIQARSQDVPLVYVANYYNAFPISIVSLKDKNITSPKDLVGKKIGLPAFWGATYTGWRALLYGAAIKDSDVTVQDVGFAQVAALTQGVVDAAAVYANNEPVQLKQMGKDINVIQVWDYTKLVGTGLVTNEKTIAERPEIVQKMVRAMVHGVQDTLSDQNGAVETTLNYVQEAGGSNLPMTKAVLAATSELWKNQRLGWVDPTDWAASAKFMKDAGFINQEIDVTKAYTNKFVP